MKLRPKPARPPARRHGSARPLNEASALAELGIKLFPTHGIRPTPRSPTGYECDCQWVARQIAKRDGVPPSPCAQPGKLPRIKGWPENATSDPEQLRAWCQKWRHLNFGALTGRDSGIWVLDIDGTTGFASLAALEAALGPLPPTWRTQSGSGKGRHYWFKHPAEGPEIRGSQGTLAAGIDVRGYHGQIIIPGSLHASGGRYRWEDGFAPDQVALSAAPEPWVRAALDANKKTRVSAITSPAKSKRPLAAKMPAATRAHNRSGHLGDGEGGGGFHGPINRIAIKYFRRRGPNADPTLLKEALRAAIGKAPTQDRDPYEIERYRSDDYLDIAIERARSYIQETNT